MACAHAHHGRDQLPDVASPPWTRASVKRACKPDSVSRARTGRRPSIWSPRCRKGSCGLPGDCSRALPSDERRCPPIWPCSGWGLPASRLAPGPGALLPHRFTLACPPRERGAIGAIVSVALSVASLRLGVTQHPARRSPDFPPRRCRSGRPALLTHPVYARRERGSSHPPARSACGGHPRTPGSGASPLCTPRKGTHKGVPLHQATQPPVPYLAVCPVRRRCYDAALHPD